MNLTNNEGNRVPTISCHQMHLPLSGLGYTSLSCWPKGTLKQSRQLPSYRLLSTNWQQGSTAEDNTYTTPWRQRNWGVGYTDPPPLRWRKSRYRKVLHKLPKEKRKHQPSSKVFCSTVVSWLQYMIVQWWHKACGSHQPYLIWLKAHYKRWNPYSTLLGWPRTWHEVALVENQIVLL